MNNGMKVLAGNTAALFVLQFINYASPLLLIPYLTRVLGLESYGVVAYGMAFVQIANIVTDYGFNLSATEDIAKSRSDNSTIQSLFSAVMVGKLFLFVVTSVVLYAYMFLSGKYDEYNLFFLLLPLSFLGQAFQPIFLFQGLEKMGYITVCLGISRLIHFGAVIIFVESKDDYWIISLSNGVSQCVGSALAFFIAWRFGLRIIWPGWRFSINSFNKAGKYFWGRAAVQGYSTAGTIFLGIFSSPAQTAIYAAAEQLYRGGVMVTSPLLHSLYPYMARTKDILIFKKILFYVLSVTTIGVFLVFFVGENILMLIYGNMFQDAFVTLKIFMIAFLFVTPSLLIGYPLLAAVGSPAAANPGLVYGAITQIIFFAICGFLGILDANFSAAGVVIAEAIVIIYRIMIVRRYMAAQ